jgi:hypothetical protein
MSEVAAIPWRLQVPLVERAGLGSAVLLWTLPLGRRALEVAELIEVKIRSVA